MPDTTWPIRYAGRVPRVGGALTSAPVSTGRWTTRDEFRGSPPDTSAVWFVGAVFDVDVTPGTVGEIRLVSTSAVSGLSYVSEAVSIIGPTIWGMSKWLRIKEALDPAEEHQIEVQLRRVSGNGGVNLLRTQAGFASSPPQGDRQAQIQVNVDSVASSYGESVQTITNPAVGSGNTMMAVSVAPGPGFDGDPVPGWTDPLGLTPILDYIATDIGTFPFVQRVRVWTWTENGEADYTFGFNNGAGNSADRLQTAAVIAFDNVIPDLRVVDRVADASNATPYPTGTAARAELAIALSTVQNSEPLLSGPAGWTEHFNNTNVNTSEFRRLGVHTLPLPAGGAVTPSNSSYDTSGGSSAHAHFLLVAHSAHDGDVTSPTQSVSFRQYGSPASPTPSLTPLPANIEHGSGGTIYAAGAGTSHLVASVSDWNTAVAAAAPGDLIRITANINSGLVYRGSKYGISGANGVDGAAGNPIIITCDPGVWIDPMDQGNNTVGLDIRNVDHVWDVGVNVRNAQFGIRHQNWAGTASDPVRSAHNTVQDTGHNSLTVQGWFQAIASSGGTPPAGGGNEWGFSEHFVVESNLLQRPGRTATQFGECIYLGYGGSPGWISHAKDGTVRYNKVEDWTADGLDCKPGCYRIDILDNEFERGENHFGAALGLCYVAATIDDRPTWFNFDPEIYAEGNRIWDVNVSNTGGTTAPWPVYLGLSGIRFAFNLIWAWQDGSGGTTSHAVRLRIEKPIAQFGTDPTHVVNNTLWSGNGFENVGDNSFTPAPGVVVRNNIVATGKTGGTHTASVSDFSAAVPGLGAGGDAEWLSYGPGSAFDLDPNSPLHGAGTSISDLTFRTSGDISQRAVPATPSPGAFVQHA